MSCRRAVVLTIAVAVAAGLCWKGIEWTLLARQPVSIVAGVEYAIDCRDDRCVLDLEFDSSSRYVLIVGSLSPDPQTHCIELASQPVDDVRVVPATRLEMLAPRLVVTKARGERAASPATVTVRSVSAIESKRDDSREFYLHVTDGSPDDARQYARVAGKLVAEGTNLRVYLDAKQTTDELAQDLPNEIVRLFESEVLPWCLENVGTFRDVDGDGKFTILLSPWLSRLQGGNTSLGGFTREADFRTDLELPFSNRCDMVYLNSSLRCDEHLRTLLIHEFTHAVCFSTRTPDGRQFAGLPPEEDWLNEAIAHISENLNGCGWTNLDYRISRFLNAPHEYPLVIDNYYDCGMWRNHGCRGATYLFLRWCVDQYGEGVLKRLIRSPVSGTRSLEWVTGESFDELYRRWTIAVYQSGRTNRSKPEPTEFVSESGRERTGDFKSLDLCGPIADWGLAGPRTKLWNIDRETDQIEVRGTSSAYCELATGGADGVRRLSIKGDYGTHLQVSLIRVPDQWPSVQVEATWKESTAGELDDSSSIPESLQPLAVRAVLGAPGMAIEMIACERNYGETKDTYCFHGESLQGATCGNQADLPGRLDQVFELPLARRKSTSPESGPLVLKVLASDEHGRRTTAWLTVEEPQSDFQITARPKLSATQ